MGFLRRFKQQRVFAMRNGNRVAVVRPEDPHLAVKEVREIVRLQNKNKISKEESSRRFDAVIGLQDYYFIGYLAKSGKGILDDKGIFLQNIQSGDSFVNPEHLETEPDSQRLDIFNRAEQPEHV